MNEQRRSDTAVAERGIVLQLLRTDHGAPWSRADLEAILEDLATGAMGVAFERLERHGVLAVANDEISASPCARHMDDLGLVAI